MTFQLIKSCKDAIPKATVTKVLSTVQWGIPNDIANGDRSSDIEDESDNDFDEESDGDEISPD